MRTFPAARTIAFLGVAIPLAAMLRVPTTPPSAALPCSMASGVSRAVIRVERDTLLASKPFLSMPLSMSGGIPGDTFVAAPWTPMPAARVRLLKLDSITRAELVAQGVSDAEPVAFIRVYLFGASCQPLRWTDTAKFVVPGEVGLIHGTLARRDEWIANAPLFIVFADSPYPSHRATTAQLASPFALYSYEDATDLNRRVARPEPNSPLALQQRATAWAAAHPRDAELQPIRGMIREAILTPDWTNAEKIPSRLRGTYRVDIEMGDQHSTWYFRTHDRPSFSWRGPDSLQLTTARLLSSPHIAGYRLVGDAASKLDSVATRSTTSGTRLPLVWLATLDRPTAPDNDSRRVLKGTFEFTLAAAPESSWDMIQPLVPPLSPAESSSYARSRLVRRRDQYQALVPITVRLDGRGGVRADTTVVRGTRKYRISLERLDTVSVRRPW